MCFEKLLIKRDSIFYRLKFWKCDAHTIISKKGTQVRNAQLLFLEYTAYYSHLIPWCKGLAEEEILILEVLSRATCFI